MGTQKLTKLLSNTKQASVYGAIASVYLDAGLQKLLCILIRLEFFFTRLQATPTFLENLTKAAGKSNSGFGLLPQVSRDSKVLFTVCTFTSFSLQRTWWNLGPHVFLAHLMAFFSSTDFGGHFKCPRITIW